MTFKADGGSGIIWWTVKFHIQEVITIFWIWGIEDRFNYKPCSWCKDLSLLLLWRNGQLARLLPYCLHRGQTDMAWKRGLCCLIWDLLQGWYKSWMCQSPAQLGTLQGWLLVGGEINICQMHIASSHDRQATGQVRGVKIWNHLKVSESHICNYGVSNVL